MKLFLFYVRTNWLNVFKFIKDLGFFFMLVISLYFLYIDDITNYCYVRSTKWMRSLASNSYFIDLLHSLMIDVNDGTVFIFLSALLLSFLYLFTYLYPNKLFSKVVYIYISAKIIKATLLFLWGDKIIFILSPFGSLVHYMNAYEVKAYASDFIEKLEKILRDEHVDISIIRKLDLDSIINNIDVIKASPASIDEQILSEVLLNVKNIDICSVRSTLLGFLCDNFLVISASTTALFIVSWFYILMHFEDMNVLFTIGHYASMSAIVASIKQTILAGKLQIVTNYIMARNRSLHPNRLNVVNGLSIKDKNAEEIDRVKIILDKLVKQIKENSELIPENSTTVQVLLEIIKELEKIRK